MAAAHGVGRPYLDPFVANAGDMERDLALAVQHPRALVRAARAHHLPVQFEQQLGVQVNARVVDLVRDLYIRCHTSLPKAVFSVTNIRDYRVAAKMFANRALDGTAPGGVE